MRVTNSMMMNSMAASLQKKTQLVLDSTEKVSTGKKFSRPSDDPLGMTRAMNYRETISKVEQYMENISRGKTKFEVMESTLEEVEDLVRSAKQIATDQSMSVLETRGTAAQQIKNTFDQLFSLANSEFENNYLFGGHQTQTPPYTRNLDGIAGNADDYEVVYNGDDGDQEIIIGKGNYVKANVHGEESFSVDPADGGVDIFAVLKDLIDGLENPDTAAGTAQITAQIDTLRTAQAQINTIRTTNAGTYDRLKSSEAYWDNFKAGMEKQLSVVEDVDITQAVMDLQNAQMLYETTTAISKEILQNSLLTFLS